MAILQGGLSSQRSARPLYLLPALGTCWESWENADVEASQASEDGRLRLLLEIALRERDAMANRVRRLQKDLRRAKWRDAMKRERMKELLEDPWACFLIRQTSVPVGKLANVYRCCACVIRHIRLAQDWPEVRPCAACARAFFAGEELQIRSIRRKSARQDIWIPGGDGECCTFCLEDKKKRPGWKAIFFTWCCLRKHCRPEKKHVRQYINKNPDTIKGWFEATAACLAEWEWIEGLAGRCILEPTEAPDERLSEIAGQIEGDFQVRSAQPRR